MTLRPFITGAVLCAVSATALHAGPPWISVELPANPHHASTRDAAFMIRAYHHSTAIDAPVQGSAHGLIDGRRITLPLDIRATHTAGVFAVHTTLPHNGAWVMAITLTEGPNATATALVSVDARGRIVAVEVPSQRTRDGWSVPRAVTRADIDAALRAITVAAEEPRQPILYGALFALPLLVVGGIIVRRARS